MRHLVDDLFGEPKRPRRARGDGARPLATGGASVGDAPAWAWGSGGSRARSRRRAGSRLKASQSETQLAQQSDRGSRRSWSRSGAPEGGESRRPSQSETQMPPHVGVVVGAAVADPMGVGATAFRPSRGTAAARDRDEDAAARRRPRRTTERQMRWRTSTELCAGAAALSYAERLWCLMGGHLPFSRSKWTRHGGVGNTRRIIECAWNEVRGRYFRVQAGSALQLPRSTGNLPAPAELEVRWGRSVNCCFSAFHWRMRA